MCVRPFVEPLESRRLMAANGFTPVLDTAYSGVTVATGIVVAQQLPPTADERQTMYHFSGQGFNAFLGDFSLSGHIEVSLASNKRFPSAAEGVLVLTSADGKSERYSPTAPGNGSLQLPTQFSCSFGNMPTALGPQSLLTITRTGNHQVALTFVIEKRIFLT